MSQITRKLDAHLWVRNPHDYYIEPFWCSSRLFAEERFVGDIIDPACGSGRILASAMAAGHIAWGSDIRPEASGRGPVDFLDDCFGDLLPPFGAANIISNPPFGVAMPFVKKALIVAADKVAMLLPSKWIHGDARARWLSTTPLRRVLFITPRPSMPPGPVIEAGVAPGGGKADFAWFIWQRGYAGAPECGWLRKEPT